MWNNDLLFLFTCQRERKSPPPFHECTKGIISAILPKTLSFPLLSFPPTLIGGFSTTTTEISFEITLFGMCEISFHLLISIFLHTFEDTCQTKIHWREKTKGTIPLLLSSLSKNEKGEERKSFLAREPFPLDTMVAYWKAASLPNNTKYYANESQLECCTNHSHDTFHCFCVLVDTHNFVVFNGHLCILCHLYCLS